MGRADGVHIVTLHRQEVLLHELVRHSSSQFRVVLMAIDTTEDNSLTIDFDKAVLHLDLSEADMMTDVLLSK